MKHLEYVWHNDVTFMTCSYGTRWGMVWTRNNEVYISRGPFSGSRAHRQAKRHIGTFKTLDEAKGALEAALRRARQ